MISYKSISLSEIEKYAELYQAVFAEPPWNETFETKKACDYFSVCCKNEMFGGIVASDGAVVCGIITYFLKPIAAGILLFIDELLVNKDYRKKGIGNRLISIVEEKYTDADIVSIIILTDKDTDAYKLYKAKNYDSDESFVVLYKNIK